MGYDVVRHGSFLKELDLGGEKSLFFSPPKLPSLLRLLRCDNSYPVSFDVSKVIISGLREQ
jgi:hypothetical protein